MLKSLFIKNIVLIDKHEIEFGDGLNILSGETGAGKSIIIHSLKFLLGDRADKGLIRLGENEAKVVGEFDLSNDNKLIEYFKNEDIELEDDTLLVERVMTSEGKNTCRVNGSKVTLSTLKTLLEPLVDICGQHENISLLDNNKHIALLDEYGKKEIQEYKNQFAEKYAKYLDIKHKLNQLGSVKKNEMRQIELTDAINEIESLALKGNEVDELKEINNYYSNSERIKSILNAAIENLNGDEVSALSLSNSALACMQDITSLSDKINTLTERLDESINEINEISSELSNILSNIDEYDEEEALMVYERLNAIYRLEKKYGKSENELIDYVEELKEELDNLANVDLKIDQLEREKRSVLKEIYQILEILRKKRLEVASDLEKRILNELKYLSMQGATFKINFDNFPKLEELEEKLTSKGVDIVKFQISTNVGQSISDLNKIISGGEMSRFMLAVKSILSEAENIPTVIFDEIDSGISGNTANLVGDRLSRLSKNTQVILITHLPQIAALGDQNYKIDKIVKDNNTISYVKLLNHDEKLEEITRLISGNTQSKSRQEHAKELINKKNERNNEFKR